MFVLGFFFADDIRPNNTAYREWALNSMDGDIVGGNCTLLENIGNSIILSEGYDTDGPSTRLRMTIKQFVQLCDDWQEKVIKREPKEVIIKHEHGEFFIETSD